MTEQNVEDGARAAVVIARQLRRRIIRGELAVGDSLPGEAELLTQFGVSRPTLRQAIRILESESLVVIKRGARGGTEVSIPRVEVAAHYAGLLLEYKHATITDVFTAAATLETAAVAMLTRSRTPADIDRLRNAVSAERAARNDPVELLRLQNEFHRLVIELASNDTLRVLNEILRHIIEVATWRYVSDPAGDTSDKAPASAAATRTHERMVEIIADRDVDAAETLWRKHIVATGARLRAAGIADSVLDLLELPPA